MSRTRVLLVEDNDFTRSMVGAGLRAENCVVVASVSSAKEALQAAGDHDIDCAVIDLHLGLGPTGIDLAHALRKRDPDIGIVVLTGYADPRLHSKGQRPLPENGVYVVKNDVRSTAQLREKIDMALGGAQRNVGETSARVPLTDTQMEILRMVAEGLTNTEIARRRVVSERAVETALARLVRKLGIESCDGENPRVMLVQMYRSLIG